MGKRVVLATPSLAGPTTPYMESLKTCVEPLRAEGYEIRSEQSVGCPYISEARAKLLRKALDWQADRIVFIDYDISWNPKDIIKILSLEAEVIAGTYRFKEEDEKYMGKLVDGVDHRPVQRQDGCIRAICAPAGFLMVTPKAVDRFIEKFPELCYGARYAPIIDLFNHGAFENAWWGEDYAFCRRFREAGGEVWIYPDLDLTHHDGNTPYPGNFHTFLRKQPGGDLSVEYLSTLNKSAA